MLPPGAGTLVVTASLGLRPERAFCLCKDTAGSRETNSTASSFFPPSIPHQCLLLAEPSRKLLASKPGKCCLQSSALWATSRADKGKVSTLYSSPYLSKYIRLLSPLLELSQCSWHHIRQFLDHTFFHSWANYEEDTILFHILHMKISRLGEIQKFALNRT